MTCNEKDHKRGDNANRYATGDDFSRVFSEELDGLYQLSYLLIGDHDKAESCFFAGLEDCYRTTHVFREWALFWAKCTIIRHAKRKLRPRPHRDGASWTEPVLCYSRKPADFLGSYFKAEAVLSLGDFERFVFVISVLERYSDRDCAVLLGCSLLEVRQVRAQASVHIVRHSASRAANPGNALTSRASAALITLAEVPTGRWTTL